MNRVRHSNLSLLSFCVCLFFSFFIELDSILFVHNCSSSSFLSRLIVRYIQSRDTSPVPTWTSMKWSFLLLRHTHVLSQRTMNSKNIQSTLDQSCLSFISLFRLNSLSQVLILQDCVPSLVCHNFLNITYLLSVNNATLHTYSKYLKIS